MFKPLTRSHKNSHPSNGAFAETTFAHSAGEDDYSGFAPTEMFEEPEGAVASRVPSGPEAAWAAASTSRTALERAAGGPAPLAPPDAQTGQDPTVEQSWATSQWVAAQEAKAHEAASQARAVIAAQRRAEQQAGARQARDAAPAAPSTGFARLRAVLERLLPGEFRSLLPLFIGVTAAVALISEVLPLIDKP